MSCTLLAREMREQKNHKTVSNQPAFFRLKRGHSGCSFLASPPVCHPTPVRQTAFFPCRKNRKKKYFLYDLSFTLYTDANEPLYNRIYIRGRTEMIYGRMGRKDFRPLAFESLLALTCGKKMSDSLHRCFVRYRRALFYLLMGSTHAAYIGHGCNAITLPSLSLSRPRGPTHPGLRDSVQ